MKLSLPAQPILLPSLVLIIGTYGPDGKPNIMNAAWGGIASSKPPYMNVSIREATLSYHNIQRTQAFTVNIPSEKYFREADLSGWYREEIVTSSRRRASPRKRANWLTLRS